MNKVNLDEKLSLFDDLWSQRANGPAGFPPGASRAVDQFRSGGHPFRAGTDRLNRNGPRFRYRLLWPSGRRFVRQGGRRSEDGQQPRETDRCNELDQGTPTP